MVFGQREWNKNVHQFDKHIKIVVVSEINDDTRIRTSDLRFMRRGS
jgi:hypothetical protein